MSTRRSRSRQERDIEMGVVSGAPAADANRHQRGPSTATTAPVARSSSRTPTSVLLQTSSGSHGQSYLLAFESPAEMRDATCGPTLSASMHPLLSPLPICHALVS